MLDPLEVAGLVYTNTVTIKLDQETKSACDSKSPLQAESSQNGEIRNIDMSKDSAQYAVKRPNSWTLLLPPSLVEGVSLKPHWHSAIEFRRQSDVGTYSSQSPINARYSSAYERSAAQHMVDGAMIEALADNINLCRLAELDADMHKSLNGNLNEVHKKKSLRSLERSKFSNITRDAPRMVARGKRRLRSVGNEPSIQVPKVEARRDSGISSKDTCARLPKLIIPEFGRAVQTLGPIVDEPPKPLAASQPGPTSSDHKLLLRRQSRSHNEITIIHVPKAPLNTSPSSPVATSSSSLEKPNPVIVADSVQTPDEIETTSSLSPRARRNLPQLSLDISSAIFSPLRSIIRTPRRASSWKSQRISSEAASSEDNSGLSSTYASFLSSASEDESPLGLPEARRTATPTFKLSASRRSKKTSPANATPRFRNCVVCRDDIPLIDFPTRPTARCIHVSKTCRPCLAMWIQSSLETTGWDTIACPDCHRKLAYDDMKNLASNDTFQIYDTLATRAVLSSMPSFHWCLSTNCKSGQIHETGVEGPIMRCVSCGFRTCVVHELEWHDGETCKQFDDRTKARKKRVDEQRKSEKLIEKSTKKCPGMACGWSIEKNDGCDHMTCVKCRHEFCWQCLAPYDPIRKKGNAAHFEICKYHTSNLR